MHFLQYLVFFYTMLLLFRWSYPGNKRVDSCISIYFICSCECFFLKSSNLNFSNTFWLFLGYESNNDMELEINEVLIESWTSKMIQCSEILIFRIKWITFPFINQCGNLLGALFIYSTILISRLWVCFYS